MSRLPGEDLGQVNPGSGERPIGSINAQPIAQGLERLGAGQQQFGQGLERAGQGVAEFEEQQARYQMRLASASASNDLLQLNEGVKRDTNYGPDENGQPPVARYQDAAGAIIDKWAGTIGNPAMAQLFRQQQADMVARGQAQVVNHAYGLYRDHQIAAGEVAGENLGNTAISTDDPVVHAHVMDQYGGLQDGLAGAGLITQDQAVAKKRGFASNLAQGLLLKQAETDPEGALNHIRAAPGSDNELVERILQVEGYGKNPRSSAVGAGQFTDSTWLSTIKAAHPELAAGRSDADLLALRADPNLGREMTGVLLGQNRASLQRQGVEANAGNLYLAHFLGPGGAAALLKANPNTPVASLLDPKAVQSNPEVLAGRTAGSVIQWAHDKMGGYSPGEGSVYSFIPPERRAQLEAHFLGLTQAKRTADTADLRQRYQDSVAEAYATGSATNPLAQEDFVRTYGPQQGPQAFQDYQAQLQLGGDIKNVAGMSPDDQQRVLGAYTPQPGAVGYAEALKRQETLGRAITAVNKEKAADPAGFAINRLPAVSQAYQDFSAKLDDQTASDADRASAARRYADITRMEQGRVGIAPEAQQIVPKSYVDHVNKEISGAADSDNPQARTGLIGIIGREAQMWGDQWPAVMRQLAPGAQPIVRAIAAGADPAAMTRLLALPKDMTAGKIMGEADENGPKLKDVTSAVSSEMAPFLRTLVGAQKDRDYPGYFGLAQKLAALDVRDGKGASDAATDAFNALIGNRYEIRDTWRIPKSAGVAADDVQRGAEVARNSLAALGAKAPLDDMPGRTQPAATDLAALGRDGVWVTAPDNSGLMLAYNSKFVRSAKDDKLLVVPWADLAARGAAPPAPAGGAPVL